MNPPIEECRYKLYQEMFAWKMVVLSLPRIQSQRYQVSAHKEALDLSSPLCQLSALVERWTGSDVTQRLPHSYCSAQSQVCLLSEWCA